MTEALTLSRRRAGCGRMAATVIPRDRAVSARAGRAGDAGRGAQRKEGEGGAPGGAGHQRHLGGRTRPVGTQLLHKFEIAFTAKGMATKYPDLNCTGKLTRVGSSRSYAFFVELITEGHFDKGGRCPDGTITVARSADKLAVDGPAASRKTPSWPTARCRRSADSGLIADKGELSPASGRPPASRHSARRGVRAQARRGPRNPCSSPRPRGPPSQASSAERRPCTSASAISAEPVERRHRMDRAEPPGVARERGARGGQRLFRLRDVHHPLRQHEARAERVARPGEHRVPCAGLPCNKPLRSFGAIAQEIGGEKLRARRRPLRPDRDAVDDGVGEPRQRHPRRVDDVALRLPFGRERLRQRARGRGERAARGRPHRTAVEKDAERPSPSATAAACRSAWRNCGRMARRAASVGIERLVDKISSNRSRMRSTWAADADRSTPLRGRTSISTPFADANSPATQHEQVVDEAPARRRCPVRLRRPNIVGGASHRRFARARGDAGAARSAAAWHQYHPKYIFQSLKIYCAAPSRKFS